MGDLSDAYETLSDPLNEPPPATRHVSAQPGASALEQLLAELSAGPHRARIARMREDYDWLQEIAEERGVSLS